MRSTRALIATAITALALAGCASAGSTTAAGAPSAAVVPSEAAAPASSGPCLTKACIASGMDKSLPGIVAEDGSVLTKAACKASTVRHNPGGSGSCTVTCVATYSDGSEWRGYGTLLHDKVYFQPVTEVR